MKLELRDISKSFQNNGISVQALKHVSLALSPGEFVAIVGPSGSGKSTLLNVLGLLERPSSGAYFLQEESVGNFSEEKLAMLRNRYFGFVFQSFQLIEYLSALENVELPLLYAKVTRRDRRGRAEALLKQVGLSERRNHRPSELSGGERQRVAVARAMVTVPQMLLADEPTGNLDSETAERLVAMLLGLKERQQLAIVMVTHNLDIAGRADRVLEIRDGTLPLPTQRFPSKGRT